MPRTTLNREKYMAQDTADLIRNKMRRQEITQQDIGDEFGICGRAVGYKLDRMNFTYPQLVKIFAKLDFTEEEIIKCMKKIMTAITGLGWLAVLIGAAAVPEDAVKGIVVVAAGLIMMGVGQGGRNEEI